MMTEIKSTLPRNRILTRLQRDIPFLLVAASVIAVDQITKYIVRSKLALGEAVPHEGILRIVHVTNSGAAFGMLQGQTFFLTITTLFGLFAIVLYYIYPPMDHGILRIALGLQLGGAIGNLSDRIRVGEVTDFIDFRYWPAFNVADSAICIGVATLVGFLILSDIVWQQKKTEDSNSSA
jgi:signal peptidase II